VPDTCLRDDPVSFLWNEQLQFREVPSQVSAVYCGQPLRLRRGMGCDQEIRDQVNTRSSLLPVPKKLASRNPRRLRRELGELNPERLERMQTYVSRWETRR